MCYLLLLFSTCMPVLCVLVGLFDGLWQRERLLLSGRALAVRRRGWERRPPLSSGSRRSRWQPVLSGGCSYGGAGWACAARRSREIRCPGGCDRSCPVIHFEWARCAVTRTLLAAWQPQVLSVFLFSSVICSNGAQRAAHSEPRCYRNTGAEILELEGVCVSVRETESDWVCVWFFSAAEATSCLSCFHCDSSLHDNQTTPSWELFTQTCAVSVVQ